MEAIVLFILTETILGESFPLRRPLAADGDFQNMLRRRADRRSRSIGPPRAGFRLTAEDRTATNQPK
jgi:hypothetical protein